MFSDKYKVAFLQIDEKLVKILGKLGNLCYNCNKPPKALCKKPQKTSSAKKRVVKTRNTL